MFGLSRRLSQLDPEEILRRLGGQKDVGPVEALPAPVERERIEPRRVAQNFLAPNAPMEAERYLPAQSADLQQAPNPTLTPKRGMFGKIIDAAGGREGLSEKAMILGQLLKSAGGGRGDIAGIAKLINERRDRAQEQARLENSAALAERLGPEAVAMFEAGGPEGLFSFLEGGFKERLLRSRPEFREVGGEYGTVVGGEFDPDGEVAPTQSDVLGREKFDYEREVRDPIEDEFERRRIANSTGHLDLARQRERRMAAEPAGGGGVRRVNSEAEYAALPSGAVFIAPDGTRRRKP